MVRCRIDACEKENGVEMPVSFFVEAFALSVGFVAVRNDFDVIDGKEGEEGGDEVGCVLGTVVRSDLSADGVLTEETKEVER